MTTREKWNYVFSKINFKASAFDADAIKYSNEIGGEITAMKTVIGAKDIIIAQQQKKIQELEDELIIIQDELNIAQDEIE